MRAFLGISIILLYFGISVRASNIINAVDEVRLPLVNFVNKYSKNAAKGINSTIIQMESAFLCEPVDPLPVEVPFQFISDDDKLVEFDFTQTPSNESLNAAHKLLKDVEFFLYTEENKDKPEKISIGDSITSTKWRKDRFTVFDTHGFQSSYQSAACQLIKDAYLESSNYNVILVNWKEIAKKNYVTAAGSVDGVGKIIAKFANKMFQSGLNPNKTIFAGHSLGAHVMGIAGLYTTKKIIHVVGLDPAGPLFEARLPTKRISPASGLYVEIIHTNAGQLGILRSVGHRDFYLNGGYIQPNCNFDPVSACSHSRSYEFYAQVVKLANNTCIGKKCFSYGCYRADQCGDESYAVVGKPYENPEVQGKFYLATSGYEPYCLGECGVQASYSSSCVKDYVNHPEDAI